VRTVTANELLGLSADAQAAELSHIDQPVIHQRISIRSSRNAEPAALDIWNDTQNHRARVSVPPVVAGGLRSDITPDAIIDDLRSTIRLNNMNESNPLSATSFRFWSDSLPEKSETVTNDGTTLAIEVTRTDIAATGQVTTARMTFRAADYHPQSL